MQNDKKQIMKVNMNSRKKGNITTMALLIKNEKNSKSKKEEFLIDSENMKIILNNTNVVSKC